MSVCRVASRSSRALSTRASTHSTAPTSASAFNCRHYPQLRTSSPPTRYPARYPTPVTYLFQRDRRKFSSTPANRHGQVDKPKPGEERKVTFIDKEGQSHTFEVADGSNLLDIAQEYDLDVEGACGGSCACSTCHLIVDSDDMYNKMEEPDDDENDMLDLAYGLTATSRLGCQVKMNEELDGLVVRLPRMTRNMQASDFEKK